MALPEGFSWQGIHPNDHSNPLVLALHGEGVVRMMDRVDGSWFARLNYHWPMDTHLVTRDCTSLEAGKRGAELWATRHEARLREEVAAKLAARPKPTWSSKG